MPKPHVLGSLRRHLDLGQKELAAAVGTTTEVIGNIELGRLRLRGAMAWAIASATGVDRGWLIANDPNAPISSIHTTNYNREFFDKWQADLHRNFTCDQIEFMSDFLLGSYARLRYMFSVVSHRGEAPSTLALHRLEEVVDKFQRELDIEPFPPKQGPSVGLDGILTAADLSMIEHDVMSAREHFASRRIELPPPPTIESMGRYRAERQQQELPPPL